MNRYEDTIIRELEESEEGFISAEVIGRRESLGYIEPKVRLVTEGGVFEAWIENGIGIGDVKWKESE